MSITRTTVIDTLRTVEDPSIEGDIVSLGLVHSVEMEPDTVAVKLILPTPGDGRERHMLEQARNALDEAGIEATVTAIDTPTPAADESILPGVSQVIAVASGKGGVGKTTVAANLAATMAERGCSVGILDADIHGPNLPRLLDVDGPPAVTSDDRLAPPVANGVKVMSMAFLTRNRDDPAVLRGPMVNNVMMHFLENVAWGELDYLFVDLPPGTGDASLDLLQTLPVAGTVIVTTPHQLAVDDARKGLRLFATHEAPILGVVENMSHIVCEGCGERHEPFGTGGAREICAAYSVAYLGAIPLHPDLGRDAPISSLDHSEVAGAIDRVVDETIANLGEVNRRRLARETISEDDSPTVAIE